MDFLWIIAKRRFSGNGAPHKSRAGSRGKMVTMLNQPWAKSRKRKA